MQQSQLTIRDIREVDSVGQRMLGGGPKICGEQDLANFVRWVRRRADRQHRARSPAKQFFRGRTQNQFFQAGLAVRSHHQQIDLVR